MDKLTLSCRFICHLSKQSAIRQHISNHHKNEIIPKCYINLIEKRVKVIEAIYIEQKQTYINKNNHSFLPEKKNTLLMTDICYCRM